MRREVSTTSFLFLAALSVLFCGANNTSASSDHSLSANIGVVSNYVWRGMSQTGDQPAIQGGIDYAHSAGFYAGTWVSNVDFGTENPDIELDFYAGFTSTVNNDLSWDINTIYYAYPDGQDLDFWEVQASGTFKWFTVGLAYTIYGENEDGLDYRGDFYYFGLFESADLPFGLLFSARIGYYDFINDTEFIAGVESESADMYHVGATLSKDMGSWGTLSLNYDQNGGKPESPGGFDNDPKFWVGWLKEFQLYE